MRRGPGNRIPKAQSARRTALGSDSAGSSDLQGRPAASETGSVLPDFAEAVPPPDPSDRTDAEGQQLLKPRPHPARGHAGIAGWPLASPAKEGRLPTAPRPR